MSAPDSNPISDPTAHAVVVQRPCSASCLTCKHWSEQQDGFGTCGNATNRELLRVLGGYMLCHAAYGCVMYEPPTDLGMTLVAKLDSARFNTTGKEQQP